MNATSFADLRAHVEAKMRAIAEYYGVTTTAPAINEVCRVIACLTTPDALKELRKGETVEQVLKREDYLAWVTEMFAEEVAQHGRLFHAAVQEFLERTGRGGTTEAAVLEYVLLAERVFTFGREHS